jgi:hypothetical protein
MSHSIVQTLHVDTPAMPRGATLVGMIHSALIALFRVARPASPPGPKKPPACAKWPTACRPPTRVSPPT